MANSGTGKNRRYLAWNQIAKALGPGGLPAFQAITGCDTVSSLAGHSKKAAFPPSLAWLTLLMSCSVVSCLHWRDSSCCSMTARALFEKIKITGASPTNTSSSWVAHKEMLIKMTISEIKPRWHLPFSHHHVTEGGWRQVMLEPIWSILSLKCQGHATCSSCMVAENSAVTSIGVKKLN